MAEKPIGEVLQSAPVWGADNRTVVVAEGVLTYLAGEDVLSLLNEIRHNSALGSRFVFSHVMADEKGRPALGRRQVRSATKVPDSGGGRPAGGPNGTIRSG